MWKGDDMDELISKRAVIEAIEKARANVGHNLERSIGKSIIEILDDVGRDVDRLPSALGTNLAEVGTDCISRQQAIDDIWTVSPLARLDRKWIDRWLRQLPSAQPEPIRINLNEPIKVKLTDWGKEIYYHQYDRANQIAGREICKPKFPKEDENGYTEFQLWCFMELYGEHMGMALPNVIEPLEIVYER